AGFGPGGVENRRGVPFREDEPVVVGVVRVSDVEPHLREEEGGDELGCGKAARRMAAAGFRCRTGGIDSEARGRVLQRGYESGAIEGHGDRFYLKRAVHLSSSARPRRAHSIASSGGTWRPISSKIRAASAP